MSASSFSKARGVGVLLARLARSPVSPPATPPACTSASASRTFRPSSTIRWASASASSRPTRARAWPAVRAGLHDGCAPLGQLQQAQGVGDVAAALADGLGHCLLGVAEALDQRVVARRLFDRVEVGALDVLDDGDLEHLVVVELAHDTGTSCRPALCAARQRRSPATISYRRARRARPHQDRLQHALLADRFGRAPPARPRAKSRRGCPGCGGAARSGPARRRRGSVGLRRLADRTRAAALGLAEQRRTARVLSACAGSRPSIGR